MFFYKQNIKNFSNNENVHTIGQELSGRIKDVISPIETAEKNKATVYGGLSGAAIGALLGGATEYIMSKKKKKKWITGALLGSLSGAIAGGIGLRNLQGRKFKNIEEKFIPFYKSKLQEQASKATGDEKKITIGDVLTAGTVAGLGGALSGGLLGTSLGAAATCELSNGAVKQAGIEKDLIDYQRRIAGIK